jgi:hypothetical protein
MNSPHARGLALLLLASLALTVVAVLPSGSGSAAAVPVAPAAQGVPLNGSSGPSNAFPTTISCPLPPVSVGGMSFNCIQVLDLTTGVLVLFGVTIILYIYKDADRAELPGDAEEVAVTGEEELERRLEKVREEEEGSERR